MATEALREEGVATADLEKRRGKILDTLGDNMSELSFEDLQVLHQRVAELAKTSFARVEDGFKSVSGDVVLIGLRDGKYVITELTNPKLNRHVAGSPGILQGGSADKEEMMKALEKMVRDCGNRIIE